MKLNVIIALTLFVTQAFAQPPDTLWTRYLDSGFNEDGRVITAIPTGGYLVASRTSGVPSFFRLNETGNVIWYYQTDTLEQGVPLGIWAEENGSFTVLSDDRTASRGAGWCVLHLNSEGVLNDCCEHLFTAAEAPSLKGVSRAQDGGFYVIGGLNDEAYTARLNSDGDTLWTQLYGGEFYDCGQAIVATADGGCFSAG